MAWKRCWDTISAQVPTAQPSEIAKYKFELPEMNIGSGRKALQKKRVLSLYFFSFFPDRKFWEKLECIGMKSQTVVVKDQCCSFVGFAELLWVMKTIAEQILYQRTNKSERKKKIENNFQERVAAKQKMKEGEISHTDHSRILTSVLPPFSFWLKPSQWESRDCMLISVSVYKHDVIIDLFLGKN